MYPLFRIHKLAATGTVSKYLILSDLTSSPSCSIQHLKRSPSSDCSRKKKAPCPAYQLFADPIVSRELTLILCMTAATMMLPRLDSPRWASGFLRRGIGIRCASTSMCFQMIWSSQQTSTPEGPSKRSDEAFCPPGTGISVLSSSYCRN